MSRDGRQKDPEEERKDGMVPMNSSFIPRPSPEDNVFKQDRLQDTATDQFH